MLLWIHVMISSCIGIGVKMPCDQGWPMWCIWIIVWFVLLTWHLFSTSCLAQPSHWSWPWLPTFQNPFTTFKNSSPNSKWIWIQKGATFLLLQKLVKPILKNPEKCKVHNYQAHEILSLVSLLQKLPKGPFIFIYKWNGCCLNLGEFSCIPKIVYTIFGGQAWLKGF